MRTRSRRSAQAAGAAALPQRPGISVKLSALHPRYEAISRERVIAELTPRVIELARAAKAHDLNLTIDAEEADRLELSLDVVGRTLADPALAGWDGFGLAVQAYQKRAPAVIDWVVDAARGAATAALMVRLVKGAYWDTEVKRAQERGLADYPVFSRKAMTDLCYMTCARKLLAARPLVYPQIATHNALTVASVIEAAGGVEGYEFQRLYGMGEALYEALLRDEPRRGLPRLCAGRRPPRPARLSGAAAAGERRQLLLRLCGGRSQGAAGGHPGAPAGRDRRSEPRAPSEDSAAPRPLCAGAEELARASSSAHAASLERLLRRGAQPACRADAEAAPLVDGVALAGHVRAGALPDRWRRARQGHGGRRGDRARPPLAAAAAGFAGLECDAGRGARRARSSAPPILWRKTAAA